MRWNVGDDLELLGKVVTDVHFVQNHGGDL